MTNWSQYLGLPFKALGRTDAGLDCYGVIHLVFRRELGIELPSFVGDYASEEERAQIDRLLTDARSGGPWVPVETPRAFDVLVFRQGRFDCHVGLAVNSFVMLHMYQRSRTIIGRLDDATWARRFQGAFRHEALT